MGEDVGYLISLPYNLFIMISKPKRRPVESDPMDDLLGKIDFQPEGVVHAAAENSRLFMQAVDFRMTKLHAYNAAKLRLERDEAELDLKLRKDARETGDKITEGAIKAILLVDEDLHLQRERLNSAEEAHEYARCVVEIFRMRRDCLQIVQGLAMTEGSLRQAAETAARELQGAREKAKARYPGA